MDRGRRLLAIARRSVWDVRERVWYDVKLWLVVTLLLAALFAWRGLPWMSVTVLTVVALGVVLTGDFLLRFTENLLHPDQHPDWLPEPPLVQGTSARFSIRSKIGSPYLARHGCEVTHPNGTTYRAEEQQPGSGFQFYFWFPRDFIDAPSLATGRYEVVWFLPRKQKLREALRHTEKVILTDG